MALGKGKCQSPEHTRIMSAADVHSTSQSSIKYKFSAANQPLFSDKAGPTHFNIRVYIMAVWGVIFLKNKIAAASYYLALCTISAYKLEYCWVRAFFKKWFTTVEQAKYPYKLY